MTEDIFWCSNCEKWSLLFERHDLVDDDETDAHSLNYVWIYKCQSCDHEDIYPNPL